VNKEGIGYTIGFAFVITFVFVFFLALANEGTKGIVAENQEIARQKAILAAMDVKFADDQEAATLFKDVKTVDKDGGRYYSLEKNGKAVYAKQFSGSGLWGTITGILAVNSDVTRTVGLQILSHNETPGLGGRIDEAWFKDQFKGEAIRNGKIVVTSGAEAGTLKKDPEDGMLDGITGASRTSQAMGTLVNQDIAELKTLVGAKK